MIKKWVSNIVIFGWMDGFKVNGHDVRSASHAYTVQLIKEATEMLSLTVMTVKRSSTTRSPASSVNSPNIQS